MKWSKSSDYSIASEDGRYSINRTSTAKGATLTAVFLGSKPSERLGLIEGLPDGDSAAAAEARMPAQRELKNLCEQHRIRQQTKGSGWAIYRRQSA